MHNSLGSCFFWPTTDKRYSNLAKAWLLLLKITMSWYSNLFIVCPQKTNILSITFCNLEISPIGKDTSRRTLFNLAGKAPIKYCYPALVPRNSKEQTLGFTWHLKKVLNPDWICTSLVTWEERFPRIEAEDIWWDSFPKISGPGLSEVCHQPFGGRIMLHKISNVYDLDNMDVR